MVLDSVLDQFCAVLGAKCIHHAVLVVGHCSGRHLENATDIFHRLALGQQPQHFPLSPGQALVIGN